MNYRLTTILLAVALLFILGVSTIQAAPKETVQPAPQAVAPAGNYDFTNFGTAWVPEVLGQYNWWHQRGWGTQAKPKTTGGKWVHIPIPFTSQLGGSSMYVNYVEFCAQSTNGAAGTGPNHMDIYAGTSVLVHSNISWWTDNAYHCYGLYPGDVWVESLGISLSLNFANATDMITLSKAWARVHP